MTSQMSKADTHHKSKLSLENIQSIIENIARCHSQEVTCSASSGTKAKKLELNMNEIAEAVMSSDMLEDVEERFLVQQIEELEKSYNILMETQWIVKDQGIRELVPLLYEVIYLIFSSTNDYFRQLHFNELLEFYFKELCTNIKNLGKSELLDRVEFNKQVIILLPIVKLKIVSEILKDKNDETNEILVEIISNLSSFFKCPRFSREDIFIVVMNYLETANYNLVSYEIIPSDQRNGHLGDYFKLNITVFFEGQKKLIHLFAKFLTPTLEQARQMLESGPSKKEDFFYATYLATLKKYGLQSLSDFSPRCYLSRENNVLVLDDMSVSGFTALTPDIKLNIDAVECGVRKIAKFHSCSMILEEKLRIKYNDKITFKELYENYMNESVFVNGIIKNESSQRDILHIVKKFPDIIKKFTTKELEQKVKKGWNLMIDKIKTSEKFKNVMCHGDLHVTNMLFKFNSLGVCEDTVLIDFQILRYCPPTHDLLLFIHQNTFKETRLKYYKQLLDLYYSELQLNLKRYNFNIQDIYPKNDFEESAKYMKVSAVFYSFLLSQCLSMIPKLREQILSNEEMTDKYLRNDKNEWIDLGMEDETYRKIMLDLTADFVELCEEGQL